MPSSSTFVPVAYVGIPLLTLLAAGTVGYWLYTRSWERRGAKAYVATLGVMSLWVALNLVHVALSDPTLQRVVLGLETTAGFAAFVAWVWFVSVYTDANYHRNRFVQASAAIFVGGYALLAATNGVHGWIYEELPVSTSPITYVGPVHAPGFLVVTAVGLGLIGYSLYVLSAYLLTTQRRTGVQLVLVYAGVCSIAVAETLGELGYLPAVGLHHAVYGVAPFVPLAAVALFRLRLFDVQPVARNTIVEHLHDPLVLLDPDGRVVDYNRAAAALIPRLRTRLGESLPAIAPELADGVPDAGEQSTVTDQLALTVDGRERHFSATVSAVTGRDGSVGWYAVLLRDVTDIESSRRQLEAQNERLDQVATTISHDMRNPIQLADGYADVLETELRALAADGAGVGEADVDDGGVEVGEPGRRADPDPAVVDAIAHVEKASNSIDRMAAIVDDVLTLTRRGKTAEEIEPVSLEAVAREAWSNVETASATLAVEGDTTIEANRDRLLSILENLVRNSVEHGGADVTVTVEPTPSGFAVGDDGPGIDADGDEVFEYGYTTETDGTGFGLAIVRTMAESHGWAVELDDEYDDGARFVFHVRGGGRATTDGPQASSIGDRPSH